MRDNEITGIIHLARGIVWYGIIHVKLYMNLTIQPTFLTGEMFTYEDVWMFLCIAGSITS